MYVGHISLFFYSFPHHLCQSDDLSAIIDEAKKKASSANDTASNTLDQLSDIQNQLKNINVTPMDSSLGNVMDDVDKSGEGFGTMISVTLANGL